MEISKSTHWRVARALLAVFCACAIALAGMLVAQPAQQAYAANGKTGAEVMFRLYNPNSGEHFYTSSEVERDNCVVNGWNDEGIGWIAPSEGQPVYRLYNPNLPGEHHYTMSTVEKDNLTSLGWIDEGVRWYSGGYTPLMREYNPNEYANNHNYTSSEVEHNHLVSIGWNDEGIGWYGIEGR